MKTYRPFLLASFSVLTLLSSSLSFLLYANNISENSLALNQVERKTEQGLVRGFKSNNNTLSWQGIPFAKPPIGELRWKAPQAPEKRSHTLIANNNEALCLQKSGPLVTFNIFKWTPVMGSEDCLYLNIVTPNDLKNDEQLPVMVWIHGGGNSTGFKGNPAYSGEHFVEQGRVILVSVNYRLGPLGWFLHPALVNTSNNFADKSGNFGTLDLIEAIKWIRANIAYFNGNPNNITVFGESAGGTNTLSLILSPQAKGLFQQAIIQSGSYEPVTQAFASLPRSQGGHHYSSAEIVNKILMGIHQANNENEALALQNKLDAKTLATLLRNFDANTLIEFYPDTIAGMLDFPALNRDGIIIPAKDAETLFSNKENYNSMPIMLGTNKDENKTFMAFDSEYVAFPLRIKDKEKYNRTAKYLTDNWKINGVDKFARVLATSQKNVYAYRFDWDNFPKIAWIDFSELIGAGHGLEVPFLFTEQKKMKRKALSDAMISYWANFAYTGSPNISAHTESNNALPYWSSWNNEKQADKFIVFDGGEHGIHMSNEELFESELKKRLANDTSISDSAERCALFKTMFIPQDLNGFDMNEYFSFDNKSCKEMNSKKIIENSLHFYN